MGDIQQEKRPMSKKALEDIQTILKRIGLYTGAIDGLIGFKTYEAVLSLEKNKSSKQNIREIQTILANERVYFGAIDGDFGNGSKSAFNQLIPAPKVTDDLLRIIQKNCALNFSEHINNNISQYQIKTKADLCAFIANIIHESSGFNDLRENMNYRAVRLLAVFPKYFKTLASAQAIASKGAIAIADVVYGGRMGNNRDGDGFKYRGGGLLHLTGRQNYTLASIGIGADRKLVDQPDLIIQPEYAIKTALWFWKNKGCTRQANFGNFDEVCQIVNGGTNGLKERKILHAKVWNTLF